MKIPEKHQWQVFVWVSTQADPRYSPCVRVYRNYEQMLEDLSNFAREFSREVDPDAVEALMLPDEKRLNKHQIESIFDLYEDAFGEAHYIQGCEFAD